MRKELFVPFRKELFVLLSKRLFVLLRKEILVLLRKELLVLLRKELFFAEDLKRGFKTVFYLTKKKKNKKKKVFDLKSTFFVSLNGTLSYKIKEIIKFVLNSPLT